MSQLRRSGIWTVVLKRILYCQHDEANNSLTYYYSLARVLSCVYNIVRCYVKFELFLIVNR